MIGTVQIEDAVGPAFAYQARMMRGNLGMREDDLVVGFSPDGNFIVSRLRTPDASNDGVYLWRAPSWEEIAAAEAKDGVESKQP